MNLHDWNGEQAFLREVGTHSVTAWSGHNEVFPLVSVYRMLWVNPRPEEPVRQVRFHSPRLMNVPVLVGLTAALESAGGAESEDASVRAETLLRQAREAEAANRLEDAWRWYREVLDADASKTEVYASWLAVAERLQMDDRILESAWRWGLSGLPAYVSWNRFGEVLEKRGDVRGALEAYQKSLQMEWNQPPIMDAVRRLEAADAADPLRGKS